MSFDEIGLVLPFSFLSSCQSEPAAVVFSLVSHNFNSIVLLVLEDAESMVPCSTDQGQFTFVGMDLEFLVLVFLEFV